MEKITVHWHTEEPEQRLEALIDVGGTHYRTAVYIDGEWHDLEQGEGWVYDGVKRYIPLSEFTI